MLQNNNLQFGGVITSRCFYSYRNSETFCHAHDHVIVVIWNPTTLSVTGALNIPADCTILHNFNGAYFIGLRNNSTGQPIMVDYSIERLPRKGKYCAYLEYSITCMFKIILKKIISKYFRLSHSYFVPKSNMGKFYGNNLSTESCWLNLDHT